MGKHKKIQQETQEDASEPIQETVNESHENHSNGKSKHKESKRKRQENSDVIAEQPAQDEEVVQSKKKKKKKEKHHEEPQPKEQPMEQASNENNEVKKSEKKKQKQHSQPTNGTSGSGSFVSKCYYAGHANEDSFSDEEVQKFWEEHQMTVSGPDSVFKPVRTFKEITLIDKKYKDVLDFFTKNFQKPTPIQSQCWPIGLSGRDLIGIAETGSGKTLSYLLPSLIGVMDRMTNERPKKKGPYVLVLAPTRELAMQIYEVAVSAQHLNINATYLVGGLSKSPQVQALKQGVEVVIATPGRLKDLMNEGNCSLSNVNFLVLDEADQMLDQGFERDIREICGKVPKQRQTLLFSATWPKSIQALANEFLNNPVHVTIGSEDLAACSRVKQIVEVIDEQKRRDRLLQILKEYHSSRKNRILIFVLYKWEAAEIDKLLKGKGWNCIYLNSDRSQQQRTEALQSFKDGSVPILVATDVAARGLDIPNVEYVINYSFPLTIEQYVHRIGRTARAGKEGVAHTMFTKIDKSHAGELVNVLRDANQTIPDDLLKFGVAIKKKEHKLYGHHFKNIDDNAGSAQPKRVVFDEE